MQSGQDSKFMNEASQSGSTLQGGYMLAPAYPVWRYTPGCAHAAASSSSLWSQQLVWQPTLAALYRRVPLFRLGRQWQMNVVAV